MYMQKNEIIYDKREIDVGLQIWNRASISLLDIRHNLISPREAILSYRLPASGFIYTCGSKAEVSLNHNIYEVEQFGLFHGGKGTELSVRPLEDWLDYYLVLYRAENPPFYAKELIRLLEQVNPFRQQYGFMPDNPIFFSEELRKMYERWKGPTPLNLFYGKTAFYRMVYEIYEELEKGSIHTFEPDIVNMARHYLKEHYAGEIAIQDLCDILGISYSNFYKSFKRETGKSPQEYLIHLRLEAAAERLLSSNIPMKKIAEHCGFADERSFYRLFAKSYGVSPNTYRKNSPLKFQDNTIGNMLAFSYNKESLVSHGELNEKGAYPMLKQIRSKAIAAAAVSLMLTLTACSAAPVNTNSTNATPTASTTVAPKIEVTNPPVDGTKIVNTVMGEVEVPTNPQRVIVQYLMGDLVALEVTPIGVTTINEGAAYENEIKDATDLGRWDFGLEDIMLLEPDLILLASDTQYEDISKIAPTVVVPYGTMTTAERLSFLGEVLSRPEEAEAATVAYYDALEEGKAKLVEAGLGDIVISAMLVTEDGTWVAGNKHALGQVLYDELGLKAPEALQTGIINAGEYWGTPSMEALADFCGDYIFHLGDLSESMSKNAVWNTIPAVKNERVLVMNTALTYYTDIYSGIAMVNDVVNQLLNSQK